MGLLVFVAALIAAFVLLQVVDRFRISKRIKQDRGYSRQQFRSHFEGAGVRQSTIDIVYDEFGAYPTGGKQKFPVSPDDNLVEVYGVMGEDLFELIESLVSAAANVPRSKLEMEYRKAELLSVGDVVRFVDQITETT